MNRRILMAMLGLLGILVAGVLIWRPWSGEAPAGAAPSQPAPAGPPAIVNDRAGNLLVIAAGSTPITLTSDADRSRQYLQITPAPDGRQVAYVAAEAGRSRLLVQALDGTPARTVYESAGRLPFYLYWAPDSRSLAFLASDQAMHLYVVPADGSAPASEIREGQPSYFDWAADSARLLLHTGGGAPRGSIATHALDGDRLAVFPDAPGDFQAPAWDAAGAARFVVISDGTRNRLVRIAGEEQLDLSPRTVDAIVFSPAPDRSRLAYVTLGDSSRSPIHVVSASGGDTSDLPPLHPLAFFWSPDGTRIASLVLEPQGVGPSADSGVVLVAQSAQLRMHWEVTTLANNDHQRFPPFVPSEAFLNLLPYFDQYALSLPLWSPDGARLIYGTAGGVASLTISDGATTMLSDGTQGFWVPGR
jgi:TolB protein